MDIRLHAPPLLITNIQYQEGKPDTANWILAENGYFSITSVWENIRNEHTKDPINKTIWHNNLCLKISFFFFGEN